MGSYKEQGRGMLDEAKGKVKGAFETAKQAVKRAVKK